MDKDVFSDLMEVYTQESFVKTTCIIEGFINEQMGGNMMESEPITRCKGKGCLLG